MHRFRTSSDSRVAASPFAIGAPGLATLKVFAGAPGARIGHADVELSGYLEEHLDSGSGTEILRACIERARTADREAARQGVVRTPSVAVRGRSRPTGQAHGHMTDRASYSHAY
jgi:hypothetical protein